MDVIYTNANREDIGVLDKYKFDLSYGASENDFQLDVSDDVGLEFGAFIYIEGTEYGGVVDARKTTTDDETVTYLGRTWHGVMNSKVIQPDKGADYLVVSGDANAVLSTLMNRLRLTDLFNVDTAASGIIITSYQFPRYCMGYDGIQDMLSDFGAKLQMRWTGRMVALSVVPVVDYTEAPVDNDMAVLDVEKHGQKVNHLICLGKGELADREVIHLYVDSNGQIGDTQTFYGLDEYAAVYDYSSVESSDDLRKNGIKQLQTLRDVDKSEMSLTEDLDLVYDIGDIVGATDIKSDLSVSATVTQKIVKIDNGTVNIEYKTGG